MSQIRNLHIYCSCGKKNLFQQVCLNKSCKAANRVYCLKCDKRNEHFTCQQNLKDEEGLIHFFEDIGKKMEIFIQNLQESLKQIVERFNELTKNLRNKCQYNQQRLQELDEQNLKNILDQIFQFQDEFEKGLREEMQNCQNNMLIKLNHWINELNSPTAQYQSLKHELKRELKKGEQLPEEGQKERLQQLKYLEQQPQQDRCPESQESDDIDSQGRYIERHPNATKRYRKKEIKRYLGAPLECLIKFLPDPTKFNLDPKITTIQNKFKIFSIEINQKAFEKNISSIERITIPNDYTVTYQSDWSCIRTLTPIVFSDYKEVYLLKIQDTNLQDEVYILKMPKGGQTYKSMNEAMIDCRSHLISKRLMQKFISQLNDKGCNTPPIRYQDLLILQENEKSFWIAERFFRGEFVKFNNNYGYINDDNQEILTILAQVFSYYTYFISDFQYMICNVQGIGYNFTDPTMNTDNGNFDDDTDLGCDGISEFIVSFGCGFGLRHGSTKYQEYLSILEIND